MASDLDSLSAQPAQLPPGFDALQYIASHGDLVLALGEDEAAGELHYRAFGEDEGRKIDTFDEAQYLANYEDLQAAFGEDTDAATAHYVRFGFAEDRTDDPQPVDEPPVEEPPVDGSPVFTSEHEVEENTTAPVVALAATDPDGGEVTFAITGGEDAELLEITDGDQLAFVDPPDFEQPADAGEDNEYQVVVTATDDEGETSEQPITVAVTDDPEEPPVEEPPANGPPVFTSIARPTVEENTTAPVVTLAADDPDGDEVTFAITGGADQDLLEITDGDQLAFVDPPDFEQPGDADGDNAYLVRVTADDGQGGTTSQNLTVTVADDPDDEPPPEPPTPPEEPPTPPGGQPPMETAFSADFLF